MVEAGFEHGRGIASPHRRPQHNRCIRRLGMVVLALPEHKVGHNTDVDTAHHKNP